MKSLQEWFGPNVWNSMPIAKTAAAFLQVMRNIFYVVIYLLLFLFFM